MNDPLKQTLLARVYDLAEETPLQLAPKLSAEMDAYIYLKREDLKTMLAEARQEFRSAADSMSRADDARLMDAVENAATLRRVDSLVYLHHTLKLWVAPHVLFTALMLVLMAIHIVQVVYFNVR